MAEIDLGKIAPIGKGDYISSNTYENLDIVRELGISYIATTNIAINENPSAFPLKWKVLVKDGINGTNANPITGTAIESNAPYNLEDFESYKVVEPISTSSAWYTAASAPEQAKFPITQDDLDENSITFDVKDGVVSVFSQPTANIADGSITPQKTDFVQSGIFPIGKNLLNPAKIVIHKRPHPATGLPFDSSAFDAIFYIPVKSNYPYSMTGLYDLAWFDENKDLISTDYASGNKTSPVGSAYLSISYGTGETGKMIQEGTFNPVIYEPFVGIDGKKIENLFLDFIFKNGNILNIGDKSTNKVSFHSEFINFDKRMFHSDDNQSSFSAGAGPAIMPTGQSNVGNGFQALSKVTTGLANTANGVFALKELVDGVDNTATGTGSMQKLVSGVGNTADGRLSLANIINNGHNSAYGDTCFERLEDGDNNTGAGYGCGIGLKEGDNNSLFGVYCGGHPQGGDPTRLPTAIWSSNSIVGAFSMQYNETSSFNSGVGKGIFFNLISGDGYNAGVGNEAFYDGVSIAFNAGVGNKAGSKLVSGYNNVFIGNRCGGETGQKTDAIGTTAIGASVISTRDNEIVIGKNTDTHITIAGVEFTRAQILALKALV